MTAPLEPGEDTGRQPSAWERGGPGSVQPRPSYWARADPGSPVYGNSTAVVVAAVVLMIFGALLTFAGAVALLGGGIIDPYLPATSQGDVIRSVIAAASLLVLVVGILQLASAIGILRHRSWARILGIVVSALLLALGIVGLLGGLGATASAPSPGFASDASSAIGTSLVPILAYGFTLLALIFGGRHFAVRQRH
jgi:hypothetical protein